MDCCCNNTLLFETFLIPYQIVPTFNIITLWEKPFKNIKGMEKILVVSNCSLPHNVFYPNLTEIVILAPLNLSSASFFNLVKSKKLFSGKKLALNPYPQNPLFSCVCRKSVLKTLWEK